MKTVLSAIIILAAGIATSNAQSRAYYSQKKVNHSNSSYGKSTQACNYYTKKVFSGYDRRGHKIFKYISVPVVNKVKNSYQKPKYKTTYGTARNYYRNTGY